MRITRLYVNQPLVVGSDMLLPADAAHHMGVVLRATVGQTVILFDGRGVEAQAEITQCTRKQVSVRINRVENVDRESPLAIHLAIGVSRGERMEFVLQKSTELGVAAITPLLCERSEVRLDHERWQKKAHSGRKLLLVPVSRVGAQKYRCCMRQWIYCRVLQTTTANSVLYCTIAVTNICNTKTKCRAVCCC